MLWSFRHLKKNASWVSILRKKKNIRSKTLRDSARNMENMFLMKLCSNQIRLSTTLLVEMLLPWKKKTSQPKDAKGLAAPIVSLTRCQHFNPNDFQELFFHHHNPGQQIRKTSDLHFPSTQPPRAPYIWLDNWAAVQGRGRFTCRWLENPPSFLVNTIEVENLQPAMSIYRSVFVPNDVRKSSFVSPGCSNHNGESLENWRWSAGPNMYW